MRLLRGIGGGGGVGALRRIIGNITLGAVDDEEELAEIDAEPRLRLFVLKGLLGESPLRLCLLEHTLRGGDAHAAAPWVP